MTPQHPQPEYIITEEDLFCLSDYIEAALNGDESKTAIRRLFDQEFGVIRSRPHTPACNDSDVLDSLIARVKHHIGFFDNAYALAKTPYEKSEAIGTVASLKLVLQDYEQLRQHQEQP